MREEEWDLVIRVHLKGHAAPTRHAMAHWRARAKRGAGADASIVHTSSLSGILGAFGQANYGAAKAGIIGLSRVAAIEGAAIGVRSNVISPAARTRLSQAVPGAGEPEWAQARGHDQLDPANVSPLVAWLAGATCPATGQLYHLVGDHIWILPAIGVEARVTTTGRWTMDALERELAPRLSRIPDLAEFLPT
jgi:NAD(P)-dependent dehydrogenase (short-subunit alcohol dehydrogenase family)